MHDTGLPDGYDLSLEVLATIPPACGCLLSRLAEDFGITGRQCAEIIHGLREYGARIKSTSFGRLVFIAHGHKSDAAWRANRYWEKVWEPSKQDGSTYRQYATAPN